MYRFSLIVDPCITYAWANQWQAEAGWEFSSHFYQHISHPHIHSSDQFILASFIHYMQQHHKTTTTHHTIDTVIPQSSAIMPLLIKLSTNNQKNCQGFPQTLDFFQRPGNPIALPYNHKRGCTYWWLKETPYLTPYRTPTLLSDQFGSPKFELFKEIRSESPKRSLAHFSAYRGMLHFSIPQMKAYSQALEACTSHGVTLTLPFP